MYDQERGEVFPDEEDREILDFLGGIDKKHYVYVIRCKITNQVYFGKHTSWYPREHFDKDDYWWFCSNRNKNLYLSMLRYGKINHEVRVHHEFKLEDEVEAYNAEANYLNEHMVKQKHVMNVNKGQRRKRSENKNKITTTSVSSGFTPSQTPSLDALNWYGVSDIITDVDDTTNEKD